MDSIHFVADKGDARLRLDQMLVRRVTAVARFSRRRSQQWIESGAVSIDGRVITRAAARVAPGAVVDVALPPDTPRRLSVQAECGALDIVHEDRDLIVVDKPAGMVVHPSYKQPAGTLLNRLLWHFQTRPDVRPGILTRLDKETSGLVVVALDGDVHAKLQRGGADGAIRKEYLAVVDGAPKPSSGRIQLPLARDPRDRRRVVVAAGGRLSETRYQVLSDGAQSLVLCTLVTGRTHQIRVHLAHRGWPVVGDRVYGVPSSTMARQALHAWRVSLTHPRTGQRLDLEAPIPRDMRDAVTSSQLLERIFELPTPRPRA